MVEPVLRFKNSKGQKFLPWVEKRLGDIASIYDGIHQTPNYVDDGVPFVSVENINNLEGTNKYISAEDFKRDYKIYPQKGDVLMTRIGDIGTSTIVPKDGFAYYVSLALIKVSQDKLLGNYLNQYIKSSRFQYELYKRALHYAFPKKINKGEIGECGVMLPCLEEQRRIAEFLGAVDQQIEVEEKCLETMKTIKRGLLQGIFSQSIRFRDSNGREFPQWVEKRLGDLFCVKMCKRILKEQTTTKGDIPFFKIGTLGKTPDAFISSNLYKTYKAKYNTPTVGDTLICCSGTVGKCIKYDGIPAYFQDSNIVWLEALNGVSVDKNYLFFTLSNLKWNTLSKSTITRIYTKDLTNKIICIPCLEEQRRIAEFLGAVDQQIEVEEKRLQTMRTIKKGLLQQMFI